MSGMSEWQKLRAAVLDGSKHRAWMARWEREYRHQNWVEFNGEFFPVPGLEPKGFSDGNRMARDNAMAINERERRLRGDIRDASKKP